MDLKAGLGLAVVQKLKVQLTLFNQLIQLQELLLLPKYYFGQSEIRNRSTKFGLDGYSRHRKRKFLGILSFLAGKMVLLIFFYPLFLCLKSLKIRLFSFWDRLYLPKVKSSLKRFAFAVETNAKFLFARMQ